MAIIALTFLLPIGVGIYFGEITAALSFVAPLVASLLLAFVLSIVGRKKTVKLSLRGGFVVVALGWVCASFLGAVPFVLSGCIPSITDAFFESVSGFTTTGATILSDISALPRCMNLWRTQMHWLGGMGIVTLTVALMPLLGVGGFTLIKAETTGPEKGKVTPKITTTAKMLWLIYAGFTALQTVLLMFAGLNFYEAISHAFASLGTGGFSTRNASVGEFNSVAVDWICTIFMLLAGVNFSLYYQLFCGKPGELFSNTEFKAYIGILVIATLIIAIFIVPIYGTFANALRFASFQAVSITTTTGFATADYTKWPYGAQMILFLLMFVGGCSGSTGGSIKVVRWVVLAKQALNEMRRTIHPHGIFSVRLNKRAGRKDLVFSVTAFLALYFALVAITAFVASIGGTDVFSSFTASLALVGNIGPGFGAVGPVQNYGFFADGIKWWFSFAMIAGRLELYTMFVFFMPSFWQR